MIETSQLQTLVAVAKVNSFSKAAEELGVTQSAISQSIKNLEKKIDVKLFKRSGKQVVLSPEGEKLFHLASGFLGNLGETLEELKHDKASMSGKVRIGTLTGVGKSWLAPEMLEFAADFPEISVAISMGFQDDLVRDFENYQLDFLVLPEEALPSSGEKVLLSEEMSTLVFPDNDQFPIDDDTDLETLMTYPTILFEGQDRLFLKWCRDRFGKTPDKINVRLTVNSHGHMLSAVSRGLGLAVVPNHVFNRSNHHSNLKTLGKQYEVSNGKFYVVYHKDSLELERIKVTLERLTSSENPFS